MDKENEKVLDENKVVQADSKNKNRSNANNVNKRIRPRNNRNFKSKNEKKESNEKVENKEINKEVVKEVNKENKTEEKTSKKNKVVNVEKPTELKINEIKNKRNSRRENQSNKKRENKKENKVENKIENNNEDKVEIENVAVNNEVKEKQEKSTKMPRRKSNYNSRGRKPKNALQENKEVKALKVIPEGSRDFILKDVDFGFKKPKLKIIPLGGLEEIGKNITVFEYENEIVIVDCGLEFPTDDMLGVDLVIPDVTYLERNKDKIKGLVITHGHEDHIGSIPYLLKKINVPIYATRLAIGLISNKLEEHKLLRSASLNIVSQGDTVNFGKIKVEFIRSCHSIPDAVMLAIHTPVGVILHTGDFKVDYTPIDDERMDFGRIAELGNQGILALMSDSTNSERKGFTMSESTVGVVFDKLFMNCTKRIVVATFASNVHRVQQIVDSAVKYSRKIAVCGRSMINMIDTAKELGYLKFPENLFIDIDMIKNYNDEQLVLITTGSQGEAMSALTRMATGEHKKVEITPNDLIIISANPISGNEKSVSNVIDALMQIGAEVVYSALADVHVSGHACQEEQKLILALAKPKYFIPVHGEYRHLVAHSETAKLMGIEPQNIFMLQNGRVLEMNEDEAKFTNSVPSGKILVDGLGVGDVGNIVLRDRQHLSQDGLIVIVMTMDSATGEIIAGPDVISRGFVYVRESENLMEDVKRVITQEVRSCEEKHIVDWSTIKSSVKDTLRDYIFQKTKRNPMILPIIMEV